MCETAQLYLSPTELGFTRVRHYWSAEVGYIRLRLGRGRERSERVRGARQTKSVLKCAPHPNPLPAGHPTTQASWGPRSGERECTAIALIPALPTRRTRSVSLIGARIPRLEDRPLLTGKGRFVDDIVLPGMLHAAFVRSPHPHAAISGCDGRAALALPGVHGVFTLDLLAPVMLRRRMLRHSNSGTPLDRFWSFALADGEVSYVGEPVAIVVAQDRYIAEDAAALVRVDYDVLASAGDCRKATGAGTPLVRRELNSNVAARYQVAYGDDASAFAGAARIFREELWQHRGSAHPIECRGIVAHWREAEQAMTVWASTQKAHDLFQSLTFLLGFDESALRVATPDVGGGFGPKLCVYSEDIAVVAAAKLLRCSIKWIEDRREHFTNAAQERDQYWSLEIAVDADAKLLGIRGRLIHDLGAYALQDVNIPYNSASIDERPIRAARALHGGHCRRHQQDAGVVGSWRWISAGRIRHGAAYGPDCPRAGLGPRRGAPAQPHPGGKDAVQKPLKARSGASKCDMTAATIPPLRRRFSKPRCWADISTTARCGAP